MPRIRTTTEPRRRPPLTWRQTIIGRIRDDKLVPILSGTVDCNLALGGHADLVKAYAAYSHYPSPPKPLPEMAQFKGTIDESVADPLALKEDYVRFVKSYFFEQAEKNGVEQSALDEVDAQFDELALTQMCDQLGYPYYCEERCHPFLLLSAFNLSVYVTTSHHEFLEMALCRAGRSPRTEFCRWHTGIEHFPSIFDDGYSPSRQEPLVYHLHGIDRYPRSLVLTEDDYLAFLVACSQNAGKATDPVHHPVRRAVSGSSLLLLGYGLQEWDFRSLFWGLVVQRAGDLTGVVSIQLEPDNMQRLYLQKYLDGYHFKISWGTVQEAVQGLAEEVLDDL